MKALLSCIFFCLLPILSFAQHKPDTAVLHTILSHYYKNEKAIYKGRNQLLFFYCEKANNNEELFETINNLKLPPDVSKKLKAQVSSDMASKKWEPELESIFSVEKSALPQKVNTCLTLEQYQEKQKRFNLNNQRLMIVSKPVYYPDGKHALVKVVFYRSIEHNNGSVLLMEKVNDNWVIKEFLNPWST
ncbi:MAG TPA: hypothetical protein VGB50_02450 [Flavobacterium sp.]|jgi:hypothetical protein